MGTFVIQMRARSAARIERGDAVRIEYTDPTGGPGYVAVFESRYEGLKDGSLLPRDIVVRRIFEARDLDQAMSEGPGVAASLTGILCVATNAAIELLELEGAYDATQAKEDHEFFQHVIPEAPNDLPPASRRVDGEAFGKLAQAVLSSSQAPRLLRAVGQYQYALSHFSPGRETFALAHLWMAVEALTPIARRRAAEAMGSREALLASWEIELKQLDAEVRRRLIFRGDTGAYADARSANDGFEHGYLEPGVIQEYARGTFLQVAEYVRGSLIETAFSGADVPAELNAEGVLSALGTAPIRRLMRGTLLGPADGLAPGGGGFPGFRIDSSTVETERSPKGHIDVRPRDALRFAAGDGIRATDVSIQLWGPTGSPTSVVDRIELQEFSVASVSRADESN